MRTPIAIPPPGWLWRRRFRVEEPLWTAALESLPAKEVAPAAWAFLWMRRLEGIARHSFAALGSEAAPAALELQRIGVPPGAADRLDEDAFERHLRLLPRRVASSVRVLAPALTRLDTFSRDWVRWSDALTARFMRRGLADARESALSARAIWGVPARFALWLLGEERADELDRTAIIGGAAGELLALRAWREEATAGINPFPLPEIESVGLDLEAMISGRASDAATLLMKARGAAIGSALDDAPAGEASGVLIRLERIVRGLAGDSATLLAIAEGGTEPLRPAVLRRLAAE